MPPPWHLLVSDGKVSRTRWLITDNLYFPVLVWPVLSSTQPSSGLSDGATAERGNGDNKTGTTGTIHGVIMSIVFLLGFPIGSFLMPLIRKWLIHASWQIIVFIGMCAGFGVGKIAADRSGDVCCP